MKNGTWQIGTSSIRAEDQLATGFRFVNWVHDALDPEVRAVPTPAATNAVYRQLEAGLFSAIGSEGQCGDSSQSCWRNSQALCGLAWQIIHLFEAMIVTMNAAHVPMWRTAERLT